LPPSLDLHLSISFNGLVKIIRPLIGACVLLAIFACVLGGIYLLMESEGGGVGFFVTFHDAKNLEPGSNLVYQDQSVGRVVTVEKTGGVYVIEARISSAHSAVLHQGSRFWVQDPLGKSLLCFDNPRDPGPGVGEGARFTGLESRPDPAYMPPPPARKLEARPGWLCEVRVTATLALGENVKDERRKSAAAVVKRDDATWVLAPAWVWRHEGEIKTRQAFVEFPGGETRTAEVAKEIGAFILLRIEESAWQGTVAKLWIEELAQGQGLAAMNAKGEYFAATLKGGALEGMGLMDGAYIACVDGTKVAGFGLPPVGDSGVRLAAITSTVQDALQ
jgi:hypothetical protein